MQVDYRDNYIIDYDNFDVSEIDRIKKITSDSDFWTDSKEGDIQNYRAAKVAVHQMLLEVKAKELYVKLKALGEGSDLEELFR